MGSVLENERPEYETVVMVPQVVRERLAGSWVPRIYAEIKLRHTVSYVFLSTKISDLLL